MKFGVLGTGVVGRTIAVKLTELGHDVVIGTRDPAKTLETTGSDAMGNLPFAQWQKQNSKIKLATFAEAAAHGEIVMNCTNGAHALDALKLAGEDTLADKVLIDLSNSLDFSNGMPPTLLPKLSNTTSMAEVIQSAFPKTKVIKTLNTVNANTMVHPTELAGADHSVFMSGNDKQAKQTVKDLLKSFGWKDIIDLGDITTARGPEMYLPLWLRMWGALNSSTINIKVVR